MVTVTVDLEDLERLVFTTGALKVIEGALAQRREDPFVKPHLDFTEAHDRLAAAVRNSHRAASGPDHPYNAPLEDDEYRFLKNLVEHDGVQSISNKERLGDNLQPGVPDSLAAKGCVVLGQAVDGIVWAGAATAELRPDTTKWWVKITPRGAEKLEEWKAQQSTISA